MNNVIVVLDGTEATEQLVADLSGFGARVTAVGANFRQVVAVMGSDVYPLVADLHEPGQWELAVSRAEARFGAVTRVIDPSGRLAVAAA
jgi:hypothetical protein